MLLYQQENKFSSFEDIFENCASGMWESDVVPLFQKCGIDIEVENDFNFVHELLNSMKRNMFNEAHPVRMTENEERDFTSTPPTVDQLQEVVMKHFNNKICKDTEVACKLVSVLDQLSIDLNYEILSLNKKKNVINSNSKKVRKIKE
jgi:hypothetical protein